MTQQVEYYTLQDFRAGKHSLYPQHFEALKKELLANVRADWKKQRILALTPERLFVLKPHWCFGRIIYHTDGRLTDSSGYTSAQDYNSEIKEVITAIIGKK